MSTPIQTLATVRSLRRRISEIRADQAQGRFVRAKLIDADYALKLTEQILERYTIQQENAKNNNPAGTA